MKWLTVDRFFLVVLAGLLLAVMTSQWVHAVQRDETVAAWEKCLRIPGQTPDCEDWSQIPEERRDRWLFQIGARDPLAEAIPEEVQVDWIPGEEPVTLKGGFPAVYEGTSSRRSSMP